MKRKSKVRQASRTSKKKTVGGRLGREQHDRPISRPLIALALLAPAFYYRMDPHRPIPKSRGKRVIGDDKWIEILDYKDPVTGAIVYSVEYSGVGGVDPERPETVAWLDGNGKVYYSEAWIYDSSGRVVTITERDANGKVLRVINHAYYQDGTVRTTVTDYSTSPATVTVY